MLKRASSLIRRSPATRCDVQYRFVGCLLHHVEVRWLLSGETITNGQARNGRFALTDECYSTPRLYAGCQTSWHDLLFETSSCFQCKSSESRQVFVSVIMQLLRQTGAIELLSSRDVAFQNGTVI